MAPVVDPGGDWVMRQRRPGGAPENDVEVQVHVTLKALKSDGTGDFDGYADWDGRRGELLHSGVLNGAAIQFTITWPDQRIGDYRGYWYTDGYLRGHTVNVSNPTETAEWWSAANSFTQVEV